MRATINIHKGDCVQAMKKMPDKAFDWAIVDPPYGIDVGKMDMGAGKNPRTSNPKNRKWVPKDWDSQVPPKMYFEELMRVSKNQIIWGGNYFDLPPTNTFCVWAKGPGIYGRTFSECEMAWVSKGTTRLFEIPPFDKGRIHPTQKPVGLYRRVIESYTKPGDKILDTHLGSGSIALACWELARDLEGYEIDEDYFFGALNRLNDRRNQTLLF